MLFSDPPGHHDPPSRLRLRHSCPLVARLASIRILAAFLGAACKIRSFESGRGAAILATTCLRSRDAKRSQPREAAHQTNRNFGSSGSQAGSLILFPYIPLSLPTPPAPAALLDFSAARTLPQSATIGVEAPPVSAPLPPPPASPPPFSLSLPPPAPP